MKKLVAYIAAFFVIALALPAAAQTTINGHPIMNEVTLAQVQAIIPQPANVVPPSESSTASTGAQWMRYALEDHVHSRITRAVQCTTVTGGTCTVTWAAMPSVPIVLPFSLVASSATQPIPCHPVVGTITMTGATIKCFQPQSILGLGLLPFTTGAAGVSVQIFAIPQSS